MQVEFDWSDFYTAKEEMHRTIELAIEEAVNTFHSRTGLRVTDVHVQPGTRLFTAGIGVPSQEAQRSFIARCTVKL